MSQSCLGERIQPLANRHRLVYRIKTSNLDLEPAPGGILADYTQFARLAVGTNIVSHPTSNGSACVSVSLKPARYGQGTEPDSPGNGDGQ